MAAELLGVGVAVACHYTDTGDADVPRKLPAQERGPKKRTKLAMLTRWPACRVLATV